MTWAHYTNSSSDELHDSGDPVAMVLTTIGHFASKVGQRPGNLQKTVGLVKVHNHKGGLISYWATEHNADAFAQMLYESWILCGEGECDHDIHIWEE